MKKLRVISLVLVVLMTMCLFSCGNDKTEDFYLEYDGDCEEMFISIESSDGRLQKRVTDKGDIRRVVYYLNNAKFKAYDSFWVCPTSIEKTSVAVSFIKDYEVKCSVYYYSGGSAASGGSVAVSGDRRAMSIGKNFEEGLLELYKSIDAPESKSPISEFRVS